jgi:hypothetical protein
MVNMTNVTARACCRVIAVWICMLVTRTGCAGDEQVRSIHDLPADLVVPDVTTGPPQAGKRVRATTEGWERTSVYHAIALPQDWDGATARPVIVEFPGNGGYHQGHDVSHGTVDGCVLGYGLTAGHGAIWVCLPFIDARAGRRQNSTVWWGDLEETKLYCRATVRDVCQRYAGDPRRVVLAGFSRGSIACNYVGLSDDDMAGLWCGLFCHSHYDGIRDWPHADDDHLSAMRRLQRLQGRPQWISHEGNVSDISDFVRRHAQGSPIGPVTEPPQVPGNFTITALPFPDHTDQWILRDIPLRTAAREWFQRTTANPQ